MLTLGGRQDVGSNVRLGKKGRARAIAEPRNITDRDGRRDILEQRRLDYELSRLDRYDSEINDDEEDQ